MSLDKEAKLDMYRRMALIRRFEEVCAELYTAGDIGGFLHLYSGEEAVGIGAVEALRPDDNVITAYRDHGIAIARRLDTNALMAELLGKRTGVSKGKGGSMHLADVEKHFWGGYAIVGGHLPLAAGLALAAQYRGEDRVTLCLMGDGATNIGYFHESLNLAAVWKLPVVWLVENNRYGMGTAVARASAVEDIAQKASAYDMPCCEQVDGMNVLAVYEEISRAVDYARQGNGPYFVEAITYRYRGHSMGDPERYRTAEEIEARRKDDPIEHFRDHLMAEEGVAAGELDEIERSAAEEVEAAVEFAKDSPLPTQDDLYADVYV
jgi:pyruvate dehydrogenase E1 component alpha subunit